MVRKRADRGRGQSDHAYQPPTPLEDAKLPLCKFCMRVPAILLDDDFLPSKERANVFCCRICAAAFALHQHAKDNVQWCPKHQCWTGPQGRCPKCDLAEVMATICPRCGKAHGPTEAKGVQHGS